MKELQEILGKIKSLEPAENAILATVVDVKGSSYRLPGAKMLILADGRTYGTVSGGCLEADVLERAKQVLESGIPEIFTYDTTTNDSSVFGFNMGCRGIIRILLEPIRDNPIIEFMRGCFEKESGVAATSIRAGTESRLGDRILFVGNGLEQNEFAAPEIRNDAVGVLKSGVSVIKSYDFGEVFYEYISPPVDIKIFGAGADAVPLAEIAKDIGWHVTVIDHRSGLANYERFKNPDEIVISRPEEIKARLVLNPWSVAVLMTHNYEHDKKFLEFLLKTKVRYIGLLGPKTRTDGILRELAESGSVITQDDFKRLHAPVGLDIGAHLPETIAVAIIAEIQSVLAGRTGGFLKNRTGAIYGR